MQPMVVHTAIEQRELHAHMVSSGHSSVGAPQIPGAQSTASTYVAY